MDNRIEFKVFGKYALFTDPITRIGGEKCSYHIPTYQALKGIAEAIYWKPTIKWIVDKVRIIKPIQTQTKGIKTILYKGSGNDLAIYTYLHDVEYQVSAHFEWNEAREDLVRDRNENKHYFIAKRMLERGGKRDVFLGARECGAYVEPCIFGSGEGAYDNIEELSYGIMFHSFDYPSENKEEKLYTRLWYATVKRGVISFPRPEECTIKTFVKDMSCYNPKTIGVDIEYDKAVIL